MTVTNKSNVTYTVDATNAKIVQGQNTIAVSNVAVGDSVVVQGTVNGNSITASSVIDQKARPLEQLLNLKDSLVYRSILLTHCLVSK